MEHFPNIYAILSPSAPFLCPLLRGRKRWSSWLQSKRECTITNACFRQPEWEFGGAKGCRKRLCRRTKSKMIAGRGSADGLKQEKVAGRGSADGLKREKVAGRGSADGLKQEKVAGRGSADGLKQEKVAGRGSADGLNRKRLPEEAPPMD